MARGVDELVNFLLSEIALCGVSGTCDSLHVPFSFSLVPSLQTVPVLPSTSSRAYASDVVNSQRMVYHHNARLLFDVLFTALNCFGLVHY